MSRGELVSIKPAATPVQPAVLAAEHDGQRTAAEPATSDHTVPAAKPGRRRVLIVDDDASILRMLRLVFQGDGFDVTTATNGHEALAAVAEHDPAVIVLDLEMPVMDGRACFRELRSRGHHVPVLILSAYGADRARAELRAEAYVTKPFDPEHLVSEVERLIESP